MKAEQKTLQALMSEADLYRIPEFQREYSWKRPQWEELFNDLMENEKEYFIGSIICIDNGNRTRDVIDGQQRLTTLSLLALAVYVVLRERRDEFDDDDLLRADWVELMRLLIHRDKSTPTLSLLAQHDNASDYCYLLHETLPKLVHEAAKPKNAGNRGIVHAYRLFESLIREHLTDLKALFAFADKVRTVQFVYVETNSTANAYVLFNSLNNRGQALDALDLIKNSFFSKYALLNKPAPVVKWSHILENLNDDRDLADRFLRQNYNAFIDEYRDVFAGYEGATKSILGTRTIATRSTLLHLYEAMIKYDCEGTLQALSDNSDLYAMMTRFPGDEALTPLQSALRELQRIQGVSAYVLLLFLCKNQKSLQLSDELLTRIITLLVSFFVRRSLTETPPTYRLDRMFMELVSEIRQSDMVGEDVFTCTRNKLLSESANDETFRDKLMGPLYETKKDTVRYILCALAGEPRHLVNAWSRYGQNNELYTWTIEHIMPKSLDETCKDWWPALVAQNSVDEVVRNRDLYVHTLGNLTLAAYNSSMARKSFAEKRDMKDEKTGEPKGLNSGFAINDMLLKETTWDFSAIQRRTEVLVQRVMEKFAL